MTFSDPYAERAVLAAILSDSSAWFKIELLPEDFHDDRHRAIFSAIKEMFGKHKSVDEISLVGHFSETNSTDAAGGVAYIAGLSDGLANPGGITGYAEIVKNNATKRRLHTLGLQLIEGLADATADESLDFVQKQVGEISSGRDSDALVPWRELVDREVGEIIRRSKETKHRIATGLSGLDDILHGFHAGEMVIAAARPGVGKTALATALAINACSLGYSVLLFSAEMTRGQIVGRVLTNQSKIANWRVQRAQIVESEVPRLIEAADGSRDFNLWIDSRSRNVARMRSRSRQIKFQHGVDLIIVDYLQRVRPEVSNRNREREVAEVSGGLKDIALDLDVPVFVACQLNREVEKRTDAKPQLSDLRESGAIEQDADTVLGLSTPDQGDERIVTVGVLKQRNGALGECKLAYYPAMNRFVDYVL